MILKKKSDRQMSFLQLLTMLQSKWFGSVILSRGFGSGSFHQFYHLEQVSVARSPCLSFVGGKIFDYMGFSSVSSAATGALAPLARLFVNAPSLAHICGDAALSH